ncbi:MAG: NAD(P)H-hydrate dehydratase [Oscillospiraceae bacterium]|nr:NAD(P)H-hydrate dehydratase [Oscillospiraceae bacterium]
MLLSNAEKMRKADRDAIDSGVSSVGLMERAAGFVANKAFELLRSGKKVYVFCGSGNNGGDGVGAAAILLDMGAEVRTFMVGSREKMTADSKAMEERLLAAGGTIEDFSEDIDMSAADVVIDAIFGVGLSRNIEGNAAKAIEMINASGAKVIAADIPSGVCADTGRILGCAVKADVTVTFSMAKIGHFVEPGCTMCGDVMVCDIDIPTEYLRDAGTGVYSLEREDVRLPHRNPISHKGDYGKLLILGGSVGYTGAPCLCARAAVRSGAGLVSLGVPEEIYPICAVKSAEEMVFPLPCEDGKLTESAFGSIAEKLSASTVCVMGMGLGRSARTTALVQRVVSESNIPMLIDADGLFALSQDMDVLKRAKAPVVLTPHEGEFARLGGKLTGDRVSDARNFAKENNCILVLKGHRTMAAFPNGEVYITPFGTPGMAKGGTGDVLAGIIGAMIGQLPLERAVITGIYMHSLGGELACKASSEYSMTASDIIEKMADVTNSLL